ncbi:MAG: efflux RND transporter periplasmic adaptor subunit [Saprospiraceae bacterium]|nr:efflux RND transporter periplasmic adaptor subunit [Saprospiraceae bacterium]
MNNKMKYITIVGLFLAIFGFNSCGQNHSEGDGHNHEESAAEHKHEDGDIHGTETDESAHHMEEGLYLTRDQTEAIGLEFGTLTSIKLNDFVKTTGTLGLPPNAYASVSAKSNGIIKGTKKYVEGNYIKKGEIIAYVENPEFIVKQQEYLESKAQLKLKKFDLERQRTLVDANAGVSKNLQSAEAEVAILEAKSVGLAKQLNYLGISTDNLTPKTISHQIAIIAPMSGYISSITLHNGMYAQSSVSLMEIVSSDHLHLELDVFEKDIASIKIGQKISYTIPALGATIYEGEVNVIGKEFDTKSKTVRIHGHLDGTKPMFLKDLFINAKIWLNDKTSIAVPEKAIIKDGENAFVYVAKNEKDAKEMEFKIIRVIPGTTDNGFTAIKVLEEKPPGMQIVIQGAYYVYAQSKAGELKHEH